MKLILTAIGTRGDLFPNLGLGRAFRAAGHDVAVVTSENFRDDVEAAGLEYLELCDTATYEAVLEAFLRAGQAGRRDKRQEAQANKLILTIPRRLYRLVEARHVPGETVFASTPFTTLGVPQLLWEKLSIPSVGVWHNLQLYGLAQPLLPAPLRPIEDWFKNLLIGSARIGRMVRQEYASLRRDLGLPRQPNFVRAWLYAQRSNLCLFPQWFPQSLRKRLPNTVLATFPLYETQSELPPALKSFLEAGTPPVVFTNASWNARVEEFFRASLRACESLGVRGVLLSSHTQALARDRADVISLDYAPLGRLLPHCAALVHHGGIGTIARAMAEATPQLIVPVSNDQPANAELAKRHGVAMVATPREFAAEPAGVLSNLLQSGEVKAACERLASRLRSEQDFSRVIAACERLVSERGRSIA